jgi:hypothetical protein
VIEIRAGLQKSIGEPTRTCMGQTPEDTHTLNCRCHSLRSSAFFLLNARSISSRSPFCVELNGIMCFAMCEK